METIITSNPEIEKLFERLRGLVDDDRFQLYVEGAEKARRDQADRLDGAMAEGEARGIAIGEARGIARGRAEEKINSLLRILTKRLGTLPESLTARISSLDDLNEIDRLSDIAFDVPTLDEFTNRLC